MFNFLSLSALLALQAAATISPSSSACTESVRDNTISFFSHAPLTFSYEVPNAPACAGKCAGISSCLAWLYSTSGQECQLYRQKPLSQMNNPHFVSGICGEALASSQIVSSSSITQVSSPFSFSSFASFLPRLIDIYFARSTSAFPIRTSSLTNKAQHQPIPSNIVTKREHAAHHHRKHGHGHSF